MRVPGSSEAQARPVDTGPRGKSPGPVEGGALDGCQVVELSQGIAGPIVGQLLADFGAEVIKIEGPEGDPGRASPDFVVRNRGKSSVMIDPDDTERCAWLTTLLTGADVCIVGQHSALAQFGVDLATLLLANPRLIVCEARPYPGEAPWLHGQESNGLLAAALGVAWRQSSNNGGPVEWVYPDLLSVQGVWAAACTVAALVERERSGVGQLVTVTGVNAVMEAHVAPLTVDPQAPDPSTANGPAGKHPTYTRFQSREGLWLACGALGRKFEIALLDVLGLTGLLDDPRLAGNVENLVKPENHAWVMTEVANAFRLRDRDEWLRRLRAHDIPCGPLEDRDAWLDHEQVRAIGMRAEVDDPELGLVVMPGVPLRLCLTPGRVAGPAPRLGQHDGEVSTRAAPTVAIGSLPPLSAGPLAGHQILDVGTFVAAPYAGMLLAELGASVVKVEPPSGDPFRVTGFVYNRGMQSLAVDLKADAGRAVFHRLAAHTDVVLIGLRPGVAARLGIDHDDLCRLAPDIITVSLSAYGEGGPLSPAPGVDMVLQGMSGMMTAQGGADEPVANTIPIIDVTSAAMLVLTATLALYHRARTGRGQRAWTSLAGTATFLQSGELVRYDGRKPAPTGGRDFLGFHPLDRYYEVRDGWLRLGGGFTPPPTADSLTRAGIEVSPSQYRAEPAAALAAALAPLPAAEAVTRLADSGIASHRARKISEVVRDPQLISSEFLHVRDASDGTTFVTPGRYATFSRTPRFGPLRSPGTGEHTARLLQRAGLGREEIARLSRAGVVTLGGPMVQQVPVAYR